VNEAGRQVIKYIFALLKTVAIPVKTYEAGEQIIFHVLYSPEDLGVKENEAGRQAIV
jgi:hypothetical protein